MSDISGGVSRKENYISVLNVLATISVVFLHTNGIFWTFSKERYWITANVIESVFYFAVPIFFMISGSTLIDYNKRYDTKEYFKRRINKTLLPYVSWTCIFFVVKILTGLLQTKDISVSFFLHALFGGQGIVDIYWYFPVLFSVYLSIPLFSFIPQEKKENIFKYMIIIGITVNVLIPFFISVIGLQIDWKIRLGVVESYLLYVLMGYYISHKKLSKKSEISIIAAGLLGLAAHIVGTYVLSMRAGEVIHTFKGYNNLPALMYSVAVFVFIKMIAGVLLSNNTFTRVIGFIKKYTFGIYLIHYPIMDIIRVYFYENVFGLPATSIIYRTTAPFLIIFICIVIIEIIRKIPVIKRIIP